MPAIMKTTALLVAGLATLTSALPAAPKFTQNQMKIYNVMKRQSAAEQSLGINDVDVLQFALTLEWLESTFYQQGFAKFPASDFQQLGLNQQQINDLIEIGNTEQQHVVLLQSAIAQAGVQPVQPCTYDFGFTDAKSMIATAAILENVGVSAYLGGGPILSDPSILGTAASILTVEARHQTFVRAASGITAVPSAFDTPLSPGNVFSLAAPFIKSCPTGSNLILKAFPTLTMGQGQANTLVAQQNIQLTTTAQGATACAFINAGAPGGTRFTAFANGACAVPDGLAGVTYINLVSQTPASGVLTDSIIVAGPMAVVAS